MIKGFQLAKREGDELSMLSCESFLLHVKGSLSGVIILKTVCGEEGDMVFDVALGEEGDVSELVVLGDYMVEVSVALSTDIRKNGMRKRASVAWWALGVDDTVVFHRRKPREVLIVVGNHDLELRSGHRTGRLL